MFTHRFFTLFAAVALLAVIAIATQAAFTRSSSTYRESKAQIVREYLLGERYGASSPHVTQFGAAQLHREAVLGERYGVTPLDDASRKTLREYWLGERYGQTP